MTATLTINTPTTERVLGAARRLGFTVTEPYAPYRGARQLVVERRDVAGCIWVGAHSGEVLRSSLSDFTYDPRSHREVTTRRATGARATRALLLLMTGGRLDPEDVTILPLDAPSNRLLRWCA